MAGTDLNDVFLVSLRAASLYLRRVWSEVDEDKQLCPLTISLGRVLRGATPPNFVR